jgi:AcrR family transcriptional regulator
MEIAGHAATARPNARERILDAAYALFSLHGVRAIGIDRIIAESGVAKTTFYHHFPSKDALVIAFLDERHKRWTVDWLRGTVERLATDPRERLLAIFDALAEWFARPDYESCSFIRTLHEASPGPVREAAIHQLDQVRLLVQEWAEAAGSSDPELVSYQLQTLMLGAIVSAARGDAAAATRARHIAAVTLAANA